jgi:hypothetical protein
MRPFDWLSSTVQARQNRIQTHSRKEPQTPRNVHQYKGQAVGLQVRNRISSSGFSGVGIALLDEPMEVQVR